MAIAKVLTSDQEIAFAHLRGKVSVVRTHGTGGQCDRVLQLDVVDPDDQVDIEVWLGKDECGAAAKGRQGHGNQSRYFRGSATAPSSAAAATDAALARKISESALPMRPGTFSVPVEMARCPGPMTPIRP